MIWNCFDKRNSYRKAKNRVEMTEPESSNLSVNEKLSRNLPNQVQQLDLKLFWYMEFRSKSRRKSQNDRTQVQQFECERKIVKKFTKPSPATWFEIVLIYGIQVEKAKTELKWRNSSPATWVWMRNCQEIYQTKSSNLICDKWNSGRKAKNRVEMTELKSSNLSVNEKLSRNLPNQVQQLDLQLLWYIGFRSKGLKQSWSDVTQVQQLECAWEVFKKITKPSPATWFEIALINGIHIEKPKTEFKWRNPSPATWVWMRNCQEIYQTKSSNLIWNCFDIWKSGRKAENGVKMTEFKSSNLSVNEKLSRNLPSQVQQLDLELLWYIEFRSKSLKQSWSDATHVQHFECERKIVKKFTKPSPATWFEIVLIYGIQVKKSRKQRKNDENQVHQLECEWEIVKKLPTPIPANWFEIAFIYKIQVEKPKAELKWRNSCRANWSWLKNCQKISNQVQQVAGLEIALINGHFNLF